MFLQVILIGSTFLLHNCFCYSPTTQSSSSCRRRQLFIDSAWVAVQVGLVSSSFTTAPAFAAAAPTTKTPPADSIAYDRVQIGHARIQYLLDHWDEVTSVCGTTIMSDTERRQVIRTENGNQCTKTPLRVQDYMGYKSINDPLYRIDKYLLTNSMISAKVKADDLVDYLEAVEAFKEKADQTAMLAYTSSWGEANPYVNASTLVDGLQCCFS